MANTYRLPGDTDDIVTVVEEGEKVPDPQDAKQPAVTAGFTPMVRRKDGKLGPISIEEFVSVQESRLSDILEEMKKMNQHLELITGERLK